MDRLQIPTKSPYGEIYGFSRVVKKGPFIYVAGTMAANEKGEKQGETIYEETKYILEEIVRVLAEADAKPEDVVRTRIFTTDISATEEIAQAHREIFGEIKPAATLIGINGLVSPSFHIEIEADAVVDE